LELKFEYISPPQKMLLVYNLQVRSIHLKYLLIGVLALLDLLKKKEQIAILGIKSKHKKTKVRKYTVLKSPFINKTSREQFKLQTHVTVIFFSLSLVDNSSFYLETFFDKALLLYGNSQYLEVKVVKTYKFL
jgi:hypothetical protein